MNNKINEFLNKQVANYAVLYVKLHNYHWYVTGTQFYQLHEKFEEFYDAATETYDELAERMLMLGGKPAATLKEYLALTTLNEATYKENAAQMVAAVAADFAQLDKEAREGIALAAEQGDDVTADILTGLSANLQKNVWMLNSVLK